MVFLLASCTSAPRYRSAPPEVAPETSTRLEIVQYANSFIGTPYRSGGASRSGMDCSGLVLNVYRHFDISLPRRSLDQSRVGDHIGRGDVEPGDLVFFKTSRTNPVSHVGIYIGRGRFIHASTRARRVRVDEMNSDYFRRRFVTARRVIAD
ncbi:MAG: C40 family peptidase [Candidatus Krumholzibacteria bacterium]|nr:C40 family peptidase [Candidatus Krumholzibacteria bacterium]